MIVIIVIMGDFVPSSPSCRRKLSARSHLPGPLDLIPCSLVPLIHALSRSIHLTHSFPASSFSIQVFTSQSSPTQADIFMNTRWAVVVYRACSQVRFLRQDTSFGRSVVSLSAPVTYVCIYIYTCIYIYIYIHA